MRPSICDTPEDKTPVQNYSINMSIEIFFNDGFNLQIFKSSNLQIFKSSNHRIIKSSNHQFSIIFENIF